MLKFADIPVRGGSQTSSEDTRGFALPTVLVLLVVLGTLTSFLLSGSSDAQKAGLAIRASARSFYAAEAGLNEVLGDWESSSYAALAPNPGDSADLGWTTLTNGDEYRVVFARIDGGNTGPAIHSIRVVGLGDERFGGSTTIFREVGVESGGAGTLFENGNAAIEGGTDKGVIDFQSGSTVSGFDVNPAGWPGCDPPVDGPGVIWEDDKNVEGESPGELMGNPDIVEDKTLTTPDLLDFGGLDFDSLAAMAHTTITSSDWGPTLGPVVQSGPPPYCDTGVDTNWGAPTDPSSPCFDHFPIIHFDAAGVQRFSGCGSGQGIILVENGNMEMEGLCGPFNFYGIIITKLNGGGEGLEIADTDFNMMGSVIVTTNAAMDGGDITFSRCVVQRALEANGMSQNPSSGTAERLWRQGT